MSGATLFERLALAQIGSHLGSHLDGRIMPVDHVTALGFSPRLGSLLIRLKAGLDHKSYADAQELIAERLYVLGRRKNWGHMDRMRRVADAALRFYIMGEICATCDGRGKMPNSYSGRDVNKQAGEICRACNDTGLAPRNTYGRAVAILVRGEVVSRLEPILDAADGILERAARIATGISRWKLYGRD